MAENRLRSESVHPGCPISSSDSDSDGNFAVLLRRAWLRKYLACDRSLSVGATFCRRLIGRSVRVFCLTLRDSAFVGLQY